VDRTFYLFEQDLERQAQKYEELERANEALLLANADLHAELARCKLAAASDASPMWFQPRCANCSALPAAATPEAARPRRKTCFALTEEEVPALPSLSFSPENAAAPSSSFSPPPSPTAATPRLSDGRAAPPVARRRRRTTIFRLPPEGEEGEGAEGSRARRRTEPPSAAALAAAQAAGEAEMAALVSMARPGLPGRDGEEAVSSFTPVSSPPLTPRATKERGRCGSPVPPPSAGRGSPVPPPRSPPLHVKALLSTPSGRHDTVAGLQVSSITALQWSGKEAVEWVRFTPRETTPDWLDRAALFEERSGQSLSDEFHLAAGEYITSLRGRVDPEACIGRAAEWLIVVTSQMRSVTIGCGQRSTSEAPSFSWEVGEGREIYDILTNADGSIRGFQQHALTASECY